MIEKWTKSKVELEPIEHVYIHKETQERFTSVTKVLHSFEPEFKGDVIAERISKQKDDNPNKKPDYIGMSKDQILEHWQYLNDIANEYGNNLHDTLERYLLSNRWYKPANDFEASAIKAYDDLGIDEGIVLYPERVLYSEEHKLAGTSDIIIEHEDNYFSIADYKTNREFNYYSKYGNYLKKPFEYLPACQFTTYTLQLSVYAYMYQLENPHMKWRSSTLLYWNRDTLTFSQIPVAYMRDVAKKMLDIHKFSLLY